MTGADPLPPAHGASVLRATIRQRPEDFFVEELDAFDAAGSGEHLLLRVEKRGMNTAFAAGRIARWAGVAESAIGYAGLKDRHAVTRQRFSVWLPKRAAPDPAALEDAGLRVLDSAWHQRKLPRGALAGNRFRLTLRDVDAGAGGGREHIDARLRAVADAGVPNYFGEQRFGRDGDNVASALAMFDGRRVRREQRSILLSAARSALFNRVLAQRVREACWDRGLDGEVWMLDGSRSVFGPEPWSDALAQRLQAFDIHPTAPLWGAGAPASEGACRALELAALADASALRLRAGLEAAGLRQERRATRIRPSAMAWQWPADDVLSIEFALPAGAYATAVLAEIGDVQDPQRPGDAS